MLGAMGRRKILALLAALPLLASAGCVGVAVPLGKETVSGPNYSKEALAFLDVPGTTREEALSYLGTPTLESPDSRILAYVCQSGTRWAGAGVVDNPITHQGSAGAGQIVAEGAVRILLIAYDENGHVYAHKVSELGDHSLQEECDAWYRSLHPKPSRE